LDGALLLHFLYQRQGFPTLWKQIPLDAIDDEGELGGKNAVIAAMNGLILGSGAREHALALACAKSRLLGSLFISPGNPGCGKVGVNVSLSDHSEIVAFCREQAIDLVIPGAEASLVAGIADDLARAGIACFGPTSAAARLEGSKGFAKDFCRAFDIPTAEYRRFDQRREAIAYIRERGAPIVVKADGLASGKGVVVAESLQEAEAAVDALASPSGFIDGGLVVEEFLEGEEVSFFALCDGESAVPFASAQDHKRVGDGDTGPNTGGMGAYSPAHIMTKELTDRTMREIVMPTVLGMAANGTPFRGVLFAGLMISRSGPKLIEYNVRFGDPEAEVILARLAEDILPLLDACGRGRQLNRPPMFRTDAALTVVMAGRGYPGVPLRGTQIRGIDEAERVMGVSVLMAAVRENGGELIADGGRVLAVTALGKNVTEARDRAYSAVDKINWPGGFCRRDIGWRAVAREVASSHLDR
jgi:phosphoribosylamine--glycine ligase